MQNAATHLKTTRNSVKPAALISSVSKLLIIRTLLKRLFTVFHLGILLLHYSFFQTFFVEVVQALNWLITTAGPNE